MRDEMTAFTPAPGHDLVPKELLGRGHWKEVYRAISRSNWHDVALVRLLDKENASLLLEELQTAFRLLRDLKSDHVANVLAVFRGDDGETYLVEELLERSLEQIAPLRAGDGFLAIARDLCQGLADLHALRPPVVHRDLKLDNCGLDHFGRAKIFDLGAATSEGGDVVATILTRSPELFVPGAKCSTKSDVWALGATLLSLRSGDYPFVSEREREIDRTKAQSRADFEKMVKGRVGKQRAEADLFQSLASVFHGDALDLMRSMLAFDPDKRPAARDARAKWATLFLEWFKPKDEDANLPELSSKAEELQAFLQAYANFEVSMSTRQWERIVKLYENLRESVDDSVRATLEMLLDRARGRRTAELEKPSSKSS
jgi:serine/threonine protein kinase